MTRFATGSRTLLPLLLTISLSVVSTRRGEGQVAWLKHGIVIRPGPSQWDKLAVLGARVTNDAAGHAGCEGEDPELGGKQYRIWYTGVDVPNIQQTVQIGSGHSDEGLEWAKLSQPVLEPGSSWDSKAVGYPVVVHDQTSPDACYKMWYWGHSGPGSHPRIGFASSRDGTHWDRHPDAVLYAEPTDLEEPWPEVWLVPGAVLVDHDAGGQTIYKMWYTVSWLEPDLEPADIHYATSGDGIEWEKRGSVFRAAEGEDWESVAVVAGAVIFQGGRYHMFYSGNGGSGSMQEVWRIGYAFSEDGLQWTRHEGNPVLPLGPPGAWDSKRTLVDSAVFDEKEGAFRMYYEAYDASGIGCATSWLPRFLRGDSNGDGKVDLSDAVTTLGVLFLGEGSSGCDDASDANDDGRVDISDAIFTLGALFLGQGTFPPPGTESCGFDPTGDTMGCTRYEGCS